MKKIDKNARKPLNLTTETIRQLRELDTTELRQIGGASSIAGTCEWRCVNAA